MIHVRVIELSFHDSCECAKNKRPISTDNGDKPMTVLECQVIKTTRSSEDDDDNDNRQ